MSRTLLLEPTRWWRQKELAQQTGLDTGRVSRVVSRLTEEGLLDTEDNRLRPRDPNLLLDAWAGAYQFDHHDVVVGHASGSGVELAATVSEGFSRAGIDHAFTGLPAAYAYDEFARYRLASVYVDGDPREAADAIGARRRDSRGANVQIIGPDDQGVFTGRQLAGELPCVSPCRSTSTCSISPSGPPRPPTSCGPVAGCGVPPPEKPRHRSGYGAEELEHGPAGPRTDGLPCR